MNFEKFYKSRKNCGIEQIDKNKYLVIGKELFACWDTSRRGRIEVNSLAENLISFGLSMSLDSVIELVSALTKTKSRTASNKVEEITMKQFIKIFEKDAFGDNATSIIKSECSRKV